MNIDKHTWTRAFRKVLHEKLIAGVVNGIVRDYSPEQFIGTRYQILHMFLNAGVSKKTLMITHHRRFTGKNKAYEWCSSYLRHSAHCMYAERRRKLNSAVLQDLKKLNG